MERLCRKCGKNACEEFSDFCGPECAQAFLAERPKKTCRICGNEYYGFKGTYGFICSRCAYKRRFEALPKVKKEKLPAPSTGIDEILEKQKKIHEQTGRWVSYGKLKAMGNK